jgi:HD-GYP domain-containing protein (c-di-GMP phosphodiesterase class II)
MASVAPNVCTELLAALSLSTDLANGLPFETALRTAVVATRLGFATGVRGTALHETYVASLLRFVGCTAFAHEESKLVGGDDLSFRRAYKDVDPGRPMEVAGVALREIGRGKGALQRAQLVARAAVEGHKVQSARAQAGCDVAHRLAEHLGASAGVLHALAHLFERWDGSGDPLGCKGTEIAVQARLVHVASVAEHFHRLGGPGAAEHELARRRGGHLDPELVDALVGDAQALLMPLQLPSVWDMALEEQPSTPSWTRPLTELAVAEAFGQFVDLQSVYTLGHSTGVALLVERAAEAMNLTASMRTTARLAGHLHDLGRVSVATGTWEKAEALSWAEWERVRLHPYQTERILLHCRALSDVARVAGAHHERLDGTGYYRGFGKQAIDPAARLLAAADAYHAMLEPRPHRPALPADKAARELRDDAKRGTLDDAAVRAVLDAAGHPVAAAAPARWPSGLTDREMDVLRELARGATRRHIADSLGIGERTVRHHIEQIYGKTGIASRAGIALFAMDHDLL